MRQIIKDIWINKKIFTMLFFGFLLTLMPILIAFSTQTYYEEHFYYSKHGKFKHYYSVTLTNIKEVDFRDLQEIGASNIRNSSVITSEITISHPELGPIQVIGLLNNTWLPPLLEGTEIGTEPSNEIVVGKMISNHIGTTNILGKEYTVKGIAGKDAGRDLIHVFNYKMYVFLKDMPDQIKSNVERQNALQLMFRSNQNPQEDIQRFIAEVRERYPEANAGIENESKKYEKEKKSRAGVNEVLSYPYKLFLIALINCINVSYLWIYLKRKEISLRKALGASNSNLFLYIISQLLICAVLAAICSFFMQWLLSRLNVTIVDVTTYFINFNFTHVIIGFLITLFIAVLTSMIPVLHILRIEPAKALKE